MPTKKDMAIHFLKLAAKGHSREAFKLYVAPHFKHHNIYFKGDAESLMLAMEEAAQYAPNKTLDVQRALEDGNLVAVHSRVRPEPEQLGAGVVHIFRFEEDKIVELWDLGQAVPEEMENEHGMF